MCNNFDLKCSASENNLLRCGFRERGEIMRKERCKEKREKDKKESNMKGRNEKGR